MNGTTKTNSRENLGALEVPIQLRFGRSRSQPPRAWLITGDAADLLNEIALWNIPLQAIRIMALPRGMLAIVEAGAKFAPTPRMLPYACLADRFFIPAEAVVHPPISDDEIARQFGEDVGVLHPTLGLFRTPRSQLPSAMSLCRIGPANPDQWALAASGVYVEPRIRSVEILDPPGMELVLESLRDDIASDLPDELPPLPEEHAARWLSDAAKAKLINMLLAGLPNQAGTKDGAAQGAAGNPLGKLRAWLAAKGEALRENLDAARNKELARLMKLLKDNPDVGLRFALPLTGESRRGTAPPASRLGKRDTDFSLSKLFRSRRGDSWNTPTQVHSQLTAKYRELANRELALGRERRAAYIYAELLGDFHSAARALMQGGFWREAAALYREKLKQIRSAAECFEKGGLLFEAIRIYDELKEHEKVGDLFALTDRPEEAAAAYRKAVEAARGTSNYIEAARLLENKLLQPDEALSALDSGWPRSNQGSLCLRGVFTLLARHGWHERAAKRLLDLKSETVDSYTAPVVVEVLAHVSRDYPTTDVRAAAADLTRVIAGTRLADGAEAAEARRLLEAVQKTAVEDRLIVRDIGRYRSTRPPDKPRGSTPQPVFGPRAAAALKSPQIIKTLTLTGNARWIQAVALRDSFVALGVTDRSVIVARAAFDRTPVQQFAFAEPYAQSLAFAMVASGNDVLLAPLLSAPFSPYPVHHFSAGNGLQKATIGWPEFLPQTALMGFAMSFSTIWTATLDPGANGTSTVLRNYNRDGRLMGTSEVDALHPSIRPIFVASNSHTWWLYHDQLCSLYPTKVQEPLQLPAPVLSVGTSPPNTLFRLIVRHAEGVSIVWPRQRQVISFARDLAAPAACLGHDGLLVAIDRNVGRAARLQGQELTSPITFRHNGETPVEILTTPDPNMLAVLYPSGRIAYLGFAGN